MGEGAEHCGGPNTGTARGGEGQQQQQQGTLPVCKLKLCLLPPGPGPADRAQPAVVVHACEQVHVFGRAIRRIGRHEVLRPGAVLPGRGGVTRECLGQAPAPAQCRIQPTEDAAHPSSAGPAQAF